MENHSSEVVLKVVRALVPPASREHVLGDLLERCESPRQFLRETLRALPYVIWSRLRRTTHPLWLLIVGAFLSWGVFWANLQNSVAAALIPALLTLAVYALRDVYRAPVSSWLRASLADIWIAAVAVLLSQALLFVFAPSLMLARTTLLFGFPCGFIVLFFLRLQSPTCSLPAPAVVRGISLAELRAEIATYESVIRRSVRIEIGACFVVVAVFLLMMWNAGPVIAKIGGAVTCAAAIFIAWFLHRFARVRPIPGSFGFAESIAAYRADLERRRRLATTYVWWYVLPFLCGAGLMVVGPQLQRPGGLQGALISVLVLLGIGAALVLLQQMAAQRAQRRMDQLGSAGERPAGVVGQ